MEHRRHRSGQEGVSFVFCPSSMAMYMHVYVSDRGQTEAYSEDTERGEEEESAAVTAHSELASSTHHRGHNNLTSTFTK
ncbi:hypothetical protein CHARACLAT_004338 [Characodon lateralis]|uniref:Uncharacterized protein n=1 Tax=Characodon lateralis TaxID=208331 RepID=A0ABU7E768_9TELE|nr:hypothetical protein [Characodon lateralis]